MIGGAFRVLRGRSGVAAVAQTGVATVLVLMVNVGTGIVSARWLGADGRGELAALLLAPQMLSFLFTFGLPAALIVTARQRPERAAELTGAALALGTACGALAMAAGLVVLPRLLHKYDEGILDVGRALLVFAVPGVVSTVLVAGLQLRDGFLAFNRMRSWQSLLVLVALVALVALGELSPSHAALAYLLPSVPFFVWNVWWVVRALGPRLAHFGARACDLLSFGLRAHGNDAFGTLLAQLDKLLLIGVLAPATFGIYVVVFNLTRLLTMLSGSVVSVLLPRTAGRPLEEALAVTSRALGVSSALLLLAIVGLVVLGVPVLTLLYGPEFADGYPVLVVLAIEASVASAAGILQQPYFVMNRVGTVAVYQALSLAVAAVLIYVLARSFGGVGAALGLLVASLVRVAMTYRGFRSVLGVAPPRVAPDWRECALLVERLRTQQP